MRVLIFSLVAINLVSGWLRASGYRDPSSGVLFPDEVGELRRGKEQTYEPEPKQGGVAIPYTGAGSEVTIYVRRIARENNVTAESALKDALAVIKELEVRGQYSNVKTYMLRKESVQPGWAGAAFTARSESRFIISFIYCKVRRGFLYKIRATTGDLRNEKLTFALDALMKVVATE